MKARSKDTGPGILWISFIALLVIVLSSLVLQISAVELPGKIDFVQYWSSFRLILQGQNPYDPELLASSQALARSAPSELIRMWNPPLTPLLLSPVCIFEFDLAASLWLFLQLAIVCTLSIRLLQEFALDQRGTRLQALGTLAIFYPLHSSLYLGQAATLLLLGVSLLFFGMKRQSPALLGFGIVLCSIKPHLFLFLILYLIWELRCNTRVLLRASLILMAALIIPALLKGNIYLDWMAAISLHSADVTQSNSAWMTATVGTWLRMIFSASPIDSRWVQYLPLLPGILMSIYAVSCRFSPEKKFMLTLCISVACSPYAWLFDFLVLYIVHIWLLSQARSFTQQGILILFQFCTLILGVNYLGAQHHFFWYPWIVLTLAFYWSRCSQRETGAVESSTKSESEFI